MHISSVIYFNKNIYLNISPDRNPQGRANLPCTVVCCKILDNIEFAFYYYFFF